MTRRKGGEVVVADRKLPIPVMIHGFSRVILKDLWPMENSNPKFMDSWIHTDMTLNNVNWLYVEE